MNLNIKCIIQLVIVAFLGAVIGYGICFKKIQDCYNSKTIDVGELRNELRQIQEKNNQSA